MTTTPTKFAHDLTLSEQREALVLALLDDLECSSSSGVVNLLSDANLCTSTSSEHTVEESNELLVESLCQVLKNRRDFEKLYRADLGVAYGAALVYDPQHESRSREPRSNTDLTKMMDEDDLSALVANMRDVSVGEGGAAVSSIEQVLRLAIIEADNPFCPAEDRPVGFGAVGSSKRAVGGNVDARISHILLETAINERYFTADQPKGIPAPVLSLGRIYIMRRKNGWLDTLSEHSLETHLH